MTHGSFIEVNAIEIAATELTGIELTAYVRDGCHLCDALRHELWDFEQEALTGFAGGKS